MNEQLQGRTDIVDTIVATAGDFEAVIRRELGDDYYRVEVYRLPRGPFDHTLTYGHMHYSLGRARKKAHRLLDQMRAREKSGWVYSETIR